MNNYLFAIIFETTEGIAIQLSTVQFSLRTGTSLVRYDTFTTLSWNLEKVEMLHFYYQKVNWFLIDSSHFYHFLWSFAFERLTYATWKLIISLTKSFFNEILSEVERRIIFLSFTLKTFILSCFCLLKLRFVSNKVTVRKQIWSWIFKTYTIANLWLDNSLTKFF